MQNKNTLLSPYVTLLVAKHEYVVSLHLLTGLLVFWVLSEKLRLEMVQIATFYG